MIAVGVTTAVRPGKPLLERCLESLLQAGFRRPWVFAEPGIPCPANLSVHFVPRLDHFGCFHNWFAGLKHILHHDRRADTIMMVQDDAVFCRDVAKLLDCDLWPSRRCGMVQAFLHQHYRSAGLPRGLVKLPGKVIYWRLAGAVACLFPRHVAQQIVAQGTVNPWKGMQAATDPVDIAQIDPFLGRTMDRLGYDIWGYSPSLCEHDTQTSTMEHDPLQRAIAFEGIDKSALDLFRPPAKRINLPSGTIRSLNDPGWQRVAVVVPMAGDCADLMESCIRSLGRNAAVPIVLFVVDNGTPEHVGQAVIAAAAKYRIQLAIIRNEENLGFTAACNQGIEAAGRRDVLLLNSDCRLAPNCLPLLQYALGNQLKVAAVGPLTMDHGAQSLRHAANQQLAGFQPEENKTVKMAYRLAANRTRGRDALPFFCVLLKRAALDEVGLLSDAPRLQSGLGVDDLWCRQAVKAGWGLRVHFGAFAEHDHRETFKRLGLDRAALQRDAVKHLNAIH